MKARTRTLTVVFTDMTDYTKQFVSLDREKKKQLQTLLDRGVTSILSGRGGEIVKNAGDSHLAVYENATDAVRACLDLMEATLAVDDAQMFFRAGVATGDVERTDNDVYGDAVIIASRLLALAPSGGIWFSSSTQLCMNPTEIPWESVGRQVMKNVPGDQEVFRAVPQSVCYLPDVVKNAAHVGMLAYWAAGEPAPMVQPGYHVLLDGFRPGSPQLTKALDSLPVIDPAHLWLCIYNISPLDRQEWQQTSRGLIVGVPQAIRNAIDVERNRRKTTPGTNTIIIDNGSAVGELVLSGLALPTVPHAEVVSGYSFDLMPDGRWVHRFERALIRVDVGLGGASVTVLQPGIVVNGQIAQVNQTIPLEPGTEVTTAAGLAFTYVAINREGYLGAFYGDTPRRMSANVGQNVEVGREPDHPGLVIPDRTGQENLRWCNGMRAARVRERGFTLDKALTGRHHAKVVFEATDRPVVTAIHETLPAFLLRGDGNIVRLPYQVPQPATLGDALVLGTSTVSLRPVEA